MVYCCCLVDYLVNSEYTLGLILMEAQVAEEIQIIRSFLEVLRAGFVELAKQVDDLDTVVRVLAAQYQALGREYGAGESGSVDEGNG